MPTVNFAVLGDSHVGYKNSLSIFRRILPRAVSSGNKRFVIFGGDNKHGSVGAAAHRGYRAFRNTVNRNLGPKRIRYKASIGNWEINTRSLFQRYLGAVQGQINFPGTRRRVKYVWLDNSTGTFTQRSINILRGLDSRHWYIIDFHQPLRVRGLHVRPGHVISSQETRRFFNAIPPNVRNRILAIFTHHAHTFFQRTSNIYPGFPRTKFYVCGCSGAYTCRGRGYYNASLSIQGNQIDVNVQEVRA
jgi:hypothetical protein